MVLAEGMQGGGHNLGGGRLGDADPHPHPLAPLGLLGIGGHGLHLSECPSRPATNRLARGGQPNLRPPARAVEEGHPSAVSSAAT